jgi:hypothetical protein
MHACMHTHTHTYTHTHTHTYTHTYTHTHTHTHTGKGIEKCSRQLALGELILRAGELKISVIVYINGPYFSLCRVFKMYTNMLAAAFQIFCVMPTVLWPGKVGNHGLIMHVEIIPSFLIVLLRCRGVFTCESMRQLVGLLGLVIGPTQGLYLHTGQHNREKRRHTSMS